MNVWEADAQSIMPLAATRAEIDTTFSFLKQLDLTWRSLFVGHRLEVDKLRHLILVGSGDSWTAALIAAAWIERHSVLSCVARQTFDFLSTDLTRYGRETLIVTISASGRLSPATEAITYASASQAQVLGLTNADGTPFSRATDSLVFTGATKRGMPTQSTSATLYLLLRLVDVIEGISPGFNGVSGLPQGSFSEIEEAWKTKNRRLYRESTVTFLGNHLTWGAALTGANLLSCGPQIPSYAFPLEEFHHSLRLNQVKAGEHFILLPGSCSERTFYIQTRDALLNQGASCEIMDVPPNADEASHLFCLLQHLYEMSWYLAVDFIEQGGQRVRHQESH